jgi:HSP20 family protein
MHTIIHPLKSSLRSRTRVASVDFRSPHYDCTHQDDEMKLVVYVPGVEAAGVEIKLHGSDLTITARKAHFVRINWSALHLENAQRDYRLTLRIGRGFDPAGLHAELIDGVLTVRLPRKAANAVPARHVA